MSEKYSKNCHNGNILVEVVPEGCIGSETYVINGTNEIWALLLRSQNTVAMDIYLWNFSF